MTTSAFGRVTPILRVSDLDLEDPDGNVLRLGSENKPGEPFGDWVDMHGVRWRRESEGVWTRV